MVSISATIPITLCLMIIISAKPNTCQKTIDALCAKTIDPGFCHRVLAASPAQSPDALLKAAVSQAAADAEATGDMIKSLLGQPNDPNLVAYFQCSNFYGAAVSALHAASQLLESRPAADVIASAGATVQSDGDGCEASFGNGAKHTLSSENRRLKIHGNIISLVCDAI